MQPDPFGNLKDWGPVLERICQLSDSGNLSECQPGLRRILAYRDNWRLREETLKRIGAIDDPSEALIRQVMSIIADSNLYYEVRIMACESMMEWLKKDASFDTALKRDLMQTVTDRLGTPQPPIFAEALTRLHTVVRERFDVW